MDTAEPGSGFADLRPFKAWARNAQVVALGESTHGTHEFFTFKHRMLEFLVEEMGFRVFAMEASMPWAMAINDYVVMGVGGDSLLSLLWSMNSSWEFYDLVMWMREYNEDPDHGQKLQIFGVDIQSSTGALDYIDDYLLAVDPGYASTARYRLHFLAYPYTNDYISMSEEEKDAVDEGIREVVDHFDANEELYSSVTSHGEWVVMRRLVFFFLQRTRLYRCYPLDNQENLHSYYEARDRCMADNALWIIEEAVPGTKMVFSGHNGHIQKHTAEFFDRDMNLDQYEIMGQHLKKKLKDKYFSLGLLFYFGTFTGWELLEDGSLGDFGVWTIPPAPAGGLEDALSQADESLFLLKIRGIPKESRVRNWWYQKLDYYGFGETVSLTSQQYNICCQKPARCHDALFFIKEATGSDSMWLHLEGRKASGR